MFFWMIVKVSLKSLAANKLRSVLAMLGVIFGVGAVIAMLAIGSGAQQQVLARIQSLGTDLLVVRPGRRGTGGVMSGTQQNLTVADALAIVEVPGVKAAAPVVSGGEQLKYFANNTRSNITGTSITYFAVRNFELENGTFFTEHDVNRRARVAVIGAVAAENLFGGQNPVDKTIKIRGINFRITGLLKTKGDQGWYNPDDQVIIPFTTAMKELFGVAYLREIDIQAEKGFDLSKLQADIVQLMRVRHRVQPDVDEDVTIQNQADLVAMASGVIQTFTILLGSVAAISLLVGGIGIMNIMLVTVTERTREIGIRKAIGAKDRDILRQFLIETLIMSGVGGLLGVAMGVAGAAMLNAFTSFTTIVQPYSIVLALGFSGAVGVFFGYYPATRAARLDPIEALRYE